MCEVYTVGCTIIYVCIFACISMYHGVLHLSVKVMVITVPTQDKCFVQTALLAVQTN